MALTFKQVPFGLLLSLLVFCAKFAKPFRDGIHCKCCQNSRRPNSPNLSGSNSISKDDLDRMFTNLRDTMQTDFSTVKVSADALIVDEKLAATSIRVDNALKKLGECKANLANNNQTTISVSIKTGQGRTWLFDAPGTSENAFPF